MTQMGLGLNMAQKIFATVLTLDEKICSGRNRVFYIDDIVVNQSIVNVNEVKGHLIKNGIVVA